jgi:hypothetical protein
VAALTRILPRCPRRLWQQYAELGQDNPGFRDASETIDDDLPVYTVDIAGDELGHARFINAYLRSVGAEPVDLGPFRTIPPPHVKGLRQVARLTNLTDLTVDAGYFTHYQSTRNPDFGASFPRIATSPRSRARTGSATTRWPAPPGSPPSSPRSSRAAEPAGLLDRHVGRRADAADGRAPGDVVDHDHGPEAQAGLPDVGDLGRPRRIRELEDPHPCPSFRRSARGRR